MARTTFLRFAIKEEVSKDPAGTPEETIRPAFDAAFVFIKDENRPGGYHFAFGVDETPGDAWDQTATRGLEDEESIPGSLNPTRPWRFGPCRR